MIRFHRVSNSFQGTSTTFKEPQWEEVEDTTIDAFIKGSSIQTYCHDESNNDKYPYH